MKKILSGILVLAMLMALALPVLAEETTNPVYYFGGSSNPNRAKLKENGAKGWYMMYSLEFNKGEEIDLTTFKECIMTETGAWRPAEDNEMPALDPAKEGQMQKCDAYWFNIRKDGYMMADNGFCAAIKWVCQEDGLYNLNITFAGGTSSGYCVEGNYDELDGHYNAPSDGVYMSAYVKGELIDCVDTWAAEGHRLPEKIVHELENVELKAGDEIYLISDPKVNSGWDDAWFYMAIEKVGELAQ